MCLILSQYILGPTLECVDRMNKRKDENCYHTTKTYIKWTPKATFTTTNYTKSFISTIIYVLYLCTSTHIKQKTTETEGDTMNKHTIIYYIIINWMRRRKKKNSAEIHTKQLMINDEPINFSSWSIFACRIGGVLKRVSIVTSMQATLLEQSKGKRSFVGHIDSTSFSRAAAKTKQQNIQTFYKFRFTIIFLNILWLLVTNVNAASWLSSTTIITIIQNHIRHVVNYILARDSR